MAKILERIDQREDHVEVDLLLRVVRLLVVLALLVSVRAQAQKADDGVKAPDVGEVLDEVDHLPEDKVVLENYALTRLVRDVLGVIEYTAAHKIITAEVLHDDAE